MWRATLIQEVCWKNGAMETTTWPEQSAAIYRRVAQECAHNEPGATTATVVFAGLYAEAKRRWRIGATEAESEASARLELLCGDVLATCAGNELHIRNVIGVGGWMDTNWAYVESQVDTLLRLPTDPVAACRAPGERYHATAAMQSISVASDSTTASLAWAGAVATARVRLGDRWYGLSADERDAHLAETMCGDPVWAAASEELDEQLRRGAQRWVHEHWDEIATAAEGLATITTAADAPATTEQRIEIARHEVRNGMLGGLRSPSWMGGKHEQARVAVVAYTEAAAEALVRWETAGGSPEGADEVMRLHAEDVTTEVGAQTWITPAARDKLREAVRERWKRLAPPASRN